MAWSGHGSHVTWASSDWAIGKLFRRKKNKTVSSPQSVLTALHGTAAHRAAPFSVQIPKDNWYNWYKTRTTGAIGNVSIQIIYTECVGKQSSSYPMSLWPSPLSIWPMTSPNGDMTWGWSQTKVGSTHLDSTKCLGSIPRSGRWSSRLKWLTYHKPNH
jgi:hypothetical protein